MSLGAASGAAQRTNRASPRRHTFVIVHGAWGGAWDWRTVDSMLTSHGHRVVRVTLTGLGERVHLASPDVGLATHIADVVNKLVWDDLRDVVLVGHSYGGMVITGVADQVPDRIRQLVYIDAFVPESGETVMDLTSRPQFIQDNTKGGFIIPAWVTDTTAIPRDVPQPLHTFTDTLRLVNPAGRRVRGSYILTFERNVTPDPFQRFAERAAARGWRLDSLAGDHVPERTARAALVALLEAVP